MADQVGPGHARRCDSAGRVSQRGICRVGAEGSADLRDDPGVRRFHCRRAGRRRGGDGFGVFRARKNRLDLSVGIALGSAAQIALFVAPVLVLLSYVMGPTPMDLQLWPGVVIMIFIATMTASLVTNSGRSTWFVGVLVIMVYLIFAMTLYLLPPRISVKRLSVKNIGGVHLSSPCLTR